MLGSNRCWCVLAPIVSAALVVPSMAHATAPGCDERLRDLHLPTPGALIDSAWALAYLTQRAAGTGGTTAVLIRYRADGTVETIDGMPSVPKEIRRQLADSLSPHLIIPQPRLAKPWSVALGLGWWQDSVLEVLPATVTCEPVLQNRAEIDGALRAAREALQASVPAGSVATRVATFQLGILTDGTVRYAQMLQGTGVPAVDRMLRDVAKQMRFSPAMVGTEPVRVIRQQRIMLRGLP